VDELIDALRLMEKSYLPASEEERKTIYSEARNKFNLLKGNEIGDIGLASLFIFLNKTCFNGLYRVNAKGGFNVPHGKYKTPRICDEDNLRAVSRKLGVVSIECSDYTKAVDFIDSRTFAYFDPPYRPLTPTASFTSYTKDGFCDSAQANLAAFIDSMSVKGAHIVASNSDPKNVDEQDNFFDILYATHKISRIQASRAINSNGAKRGKVNELLIANGQ
jgi:DNA adenine methylase